MKKQFSSKTVISLLFVMLVVISYLVVPSLALETKSKILAGEGVVGVGESYELYQGYSVRMVEPASSGGKIIMEILLEGKSIEGNIFISEDEVYQFTRTYDGEKYLILAITLIDVDIDELTATLGVTQYIDPLLPSPGFLITDNDETLEPGTRLSLKQGYSLNVEKIKPDSVILGLYKNDVKVKEQEMEKDDVFNYSVTASGKDHTIVTFNLKSIFEGSARSAVFIEHLYQFEEPLLSEIPVPITTPGNYSESNIAVSVKAIGSDGGSKIYGNETINVTYSISCNASFESVYITLDDNIIEELTNPQSGTYTITLEPLPDGDHVIKVSALSSAGMLGSAETKIYVLKNFDANKFIPDFSQISAPIVFTGASLLLIFWASIRSRGHNRR